MLIGYFNHDSWVTDSDEITEEEDKLTHWIYISKIERPNKEKK